jgi:hypothetical protein
MVLNEDKKRVQGYRGFVLYSQNNGLDDVFVDYFKLSQRDSFDSYLRGDIFDATVVDSLWLDKPVSKKSLEDIVRPKLDNYI